MPKVLKRGSIKDPDRMFSDLAQDIGKYYAEIGRNLGLKQSRLDNELESDRFLFAPPSEKAMNMLTMWKQSVTEESFTYSALAAALEKNDLLRECADKYCYIGLPSHYDTKLAARTAEPSTQGLKGVIVCAETHVTVTNDARSFTWEGYGLKLDIKEKSLPKGTEKITIYIKASITGDYDIQEGYERVSPVFWFRCDPMCKLEKEVTLEIQHCVMLEWVCDLTFARADCSQKKRPYTFELLKGGQFSNQSPYGILELHGFSGIAAYLKHLILGSRRYFAQLFYLNRLTVSTVQEIHLAVTWHTSTHITKMKEKYLADMAKPGPCSGIQFEKDKIILTLDHCEDGWELIKLNALEITKSEVDECSDPPSCQLLARIVDKTKRLPIHWTVKMNGAMPPKDFLTIYYEPDPIPSPIRVVKPGSIEEPDRLFKDLAQEIGAKYEEVGIDLSLTFRDLHNALDTGSYATLPANKKALNMLMLWRDKSPDKDFTYSVLATALEKNELQRFADKYCYMDHSGSQ